MGVKSYSELIAWQKAMDLVETVYAASRKFPREEAFGLTIQLPASRCLGDVEHSRRARPEVEG